VTPHRALLVFIAGVALILLGLVYIGLSSLDDDAWPGLFLGAAGLTLCFVATESDWTNK
jgi:hypothetical protein